MQACPSKPCGKHHYYLENSATGLFPENHIFPPPDNFIVLVAARGRVSLKISLVQKHFLVINDLLKIIDFGKLHQRPVFSCG
jgi:hypothetical protein